MLRCYASPFVFAFALASLPSLVSANTLFTAGYLSVDSTGASTATLDIYNQTGSNDSTYPDTSFPIASSLQFTGISLLLDFTGGGSVTESISKFTSDATGDLIGDFNIDLSKFSIAEAVLTGIFNRTSVTLNNGAKAAVYADFTTTLLPSSGDALAVGDFALIDAAKTPEPAGYSIAIAGFLVLMVSPVIRKAVP